MSKPSKLGKYTLRRELGKGAMGIVYEGYDPFIERPVAIKTIQKSLVEKSEAAEAFSRFRREAQAAGRLSHPKIVSVYEYGEEGDVAFIAMEFVTGRELKDLFDEGKRFSVPESLHIMLQILDALDYSHNRGVIHRDIKPANILISDDSQIKIADFGIAKIDASHMTQIGTVLGTPAYMSPEQFLGNPVDRRSDIYSAGVILYQFLTGEKPFSGSMISIMQKVLHEQPPLPSQLNPNVSDALQAVVMNALSKEVAQRYQTASEFMIALKAAAEKPVKIIDPDATLIVEDTLVTPPAPAAAPEPYSKERDIAAWKRISNSAQESDFRDYLQQFPQGEFAELAQRRIAAMGKAKADALDEEIRRLHQAELQTAQQQKQQEAQRRAVLEARMKVEAETRARLEAAARRQQEEAAKAQLAQRMAQLRAEANQAREQQEAQRKLESTEKNRRTQELAGLMEERAKKFSAALSQREAEQEAQRKLEEEARNKLASKRPRRPRP